MRIRLVGQAWNDIDVVRAALAAGGHEVVEDGGDVVLVECDQPDTHPFIDSSRPVIGVTSDPRGVASMVPPFQDVLLRPLTVDGVLTRIQVAERCWRRARENNERFELVARATNDAVYDWDVTTGAIRWNEALGSMLRHQPEAGPADIAWWEGGIHPDDRARVLDSLTAAVEGGAAQWTAEYRFRRGDGQEAAILDRGLFMRGADGRATRMIGVMTDVTVMNEMRARLVMAERLAAIGTMAAGVAHEIAQPLTWVIAKLGVASEGLAQLPGSARMDSVRNALEMATEGAGRIRSLVKDLRVFSRAEEETRLVVDPGRVMDSAAAIASAEIRQRAKLVRRYECTRHVEVNEARLGQVFLNLVMNAAQAIPAGNSDGNSITLTTRDDGPWVVTEVRDTGPGIPPAVRERIFDVFYTTKGPGEGTGLGLAISRRLAGEMGGSIEVESAEGKGAVFRVRLPAVAAPIAEAIPSHLKARPRRGTVLVVDDEEMIVSFLERVIEVEHDVEGLTHPRSALERLLGGAKFDVVLCDLMMPELTGAELYEAVREREPAQADRFVFITGGAFTPKTRQFLEHSRVPVLEKPFDIKTLMGVLRGRVG